jgi:hypothetical protein
LVLGRSKTLDWIGGFAALVSLGEVIQATENHLQRNAVEGQQEFFGDRIAQVNQEGEEQPCLPDLQEDAIECTPPSTGKLG